MTKPKNDLDEFGLAPQKVFVRLKDEEKPSSNIHMALTREQFDNLRENLGLPEVTKEQQSAAEKGTAIHESIENNFAENGIFQSSVVRGIQYIPPMTEVRKQAKAFVIKGNEWPQFIPAGGGGADVDALKQEMNELREQNKQLMDKMNQVLNTHTEIHDSSGNVIGIANNGDLLTPTDIEKLAKK